jgi:protein-tyrosine-phosphatase
MTNRAPNISSPATVLFVCLHGSAKSLIAAQHFTRLARERGLRYRGESAGLEPDSELPAPVAAGLARDGIDIAGYVPRVVTAASVAEAAYVVSFGCDLPETMVGVRHERWDDLPMVSDGFERARDAIVARVERLIDTVA